MSLSGALNASRSGLLATSAWSETTAGNVANASTEGYVRRGVMLTTRQAGGSASVGVAGITREVDASLQRMHRTEISRAATQETTSGALQGYAAALGGTDDARSLSGRVSELQSAFDSLSASPSETGLQRAALEAAEGLTEEFHTLSAALEGTRQDVLSDMETHVADANDALTRLAELDERRAKAEPGSSGRAAVEDQIDAQIDALSGLMDVTVSRGGDGRLSINASGGAPLLGNGEVETLSWSQGVLRAGSAEITPGTEGVRGITEGTIAAEARLLNETLPTFGLQLDEMARGVIDVMGQADGSAAAGKAGLFTDPQGGPLEGLAGRISVNPLARPEDGGALWRWRDGMAVATEGPAGDSTQINAFAEALEGTTTFAVGAGLGTNESLGDYAAALMADQQMTRTRALDSLDGIETRLQTFETARSSVEGVNIDDELQQLMTIEQSYAANSKIMTSVAEMIDTLLAAV